MFMLKSFEKTLRVYYTIVSSNKTALYLNNINK